MAPISIWMSGCVIWISKKETGILHTVAISIETFVRVSALYLLEIFLEITDIKENAGDNAQGIWETNIFGKTIEQIVDDGIYEKTHNMTPESMEKISSTLEKVMNENSGLVCLIV